MQYTKTRPLSPHLTIYRMQNFIFSGLHRITGISLFIGLLASIWWVIYLPYMQNINESMIWRFFTKSTGKGIIILWSYSLFYHLCTGIRHLFWDFGKGYSLKNLQISSWIVALSSILLTSISWILAFEIGK